MAQPPAPHCLGQRPPLRAACTPWAQCCFHCGVGAGAGSTASGTAGTVAATRPGQLDLDLSTVACCVAAAFTAMASTSSAAAASTAMASSGSAAAASTAMASSGNAAASTGIAAASTETNGTSAAIVDPTAAASRVALAAAAAGASSWNTDTAGCAAGVAVGSSSISSQASRTSMQMVQEGEVALKVRNTPQARSGAPQRHQGGGAWDPPCRHLTTALHQLAWLCRWRCSLLRMPGNSFITTTSC